MADQLDVAVGNILGGIAIQTVVLVMLDAATTSRIRASGSPHSAFSSATTTGCVGR
jgi:hypothetical protein